MRTVSEAEDERLLRRRRPPSGQATTAFPLLIIALLLHLPLPMKQAATPTSVVIRAGTSLSLLVTTATLLTRRLSHPVARDRGATRALSPAWDGPPVEEEEDMVVGRLLLRGRHRGRGRWIRGSEDGR